MEGNIESDITSPKLLNLLDIARLKKECECLGLDPMGGKRNLIERLQRSGIFEINDSIPITKREWKTYHNYPNKDSIFIGHEAGLNETEKNKLYISNSKTENPLVKGDFKEEKLIINNCFKIENSIVDTDVQGEEGEIRRNGSNLYMYRSSNVVEGWYPLYFGPVVLL